MPKTCADAQSMIGLGVAAIDNNQQVYVKSEEMRAYRFCLSGGQELVGRSDRGKERKSKGCCINQASRIIY
jgi:hypothetical protein